MNGNRKIYLSGPMTGLPEFNYPAFHNKAAELREQGHEVFNPSEHDHDINNFPLKQCFMMYCDYIINSADTIVLLPGWANSKGARAEKALAEVFGLDIQYCETDR